MKKLPIILSIFYLMIVGCTSNKELSREEAFKQLQQEEGYPKVFDYDIYRSDPKYARRVLDAGLENAGLVTVQRTQKLVDVGKPLISFTDKAKPYFVETSAKDKAIDVQKVKLADVDLVEVANIRTNGPGNKALVNYTTRYKNITPFSPLVNANYNEKKTNKAYFSLTDEGWKLEKKPDLDFLELEK